MFILFWGLHLKFKIS